VSDQLADAWDRGVFSTLSECLGDGIESERASRLLNCLLRIVREADRMRDSYRMDGQTAEMEYDKVRAELDGLL
jgi:hypothetical protein